MIKQSRRNEDIIIGYYTYRTVKCLTNISNPAYKDFLLLVDNCFKHYL